MKIREENKQYEELFTPTKQKPAGFCCRTDHFIFILAGEVEAAEYYYNGWDMATDDGTTTWDDETQTATLHADRSIYRTFAYSSSFGLPTQPEVQFASLGTTLYTDSGWLWNSYDVVGATKSETLTLYGDIIATQTKKLSVHDLDTLRITNGTYGLEANEGKQNY